MDFLTLISIGSFAIDLGSVPVAILMALRYEARVRALEADNQALRERLLYLHQLELAQMDYEDPLHH